MNYTVQKPDGTEVHFRSRDDLVIAYNNHEIDARWPGKGEGATEWTGVWALLGVPRPATTDPSPGASRLDTSPKKCVVKRPNGETMTVTLESLSARYDNGAVRADWPAKVEEASDWTTVGAILGTQSQAPASIGEPAAVAATQPVSSAVAKSAVGRGIDRYQDAYRVAAATVAIGAAVKVLAICLAGLCLIGAVAGASQSIANLSSLNAAPLLVGLVAAVAVGVPLYALGILVSAAGQVLKATLDTAVHTSPFLDKAQMAQIMIRH